MRRLFALLTLCCLSISMAWADSESLYVYRNDGDFNYFVTERLDSVVYSNIDMAGKACSEPVVQEFWVGGKATRIPLAAIDSIRFVSPEENLRLVDPVRYKRPANDATYNPNILIDYMESIQLLSIDTTAMMAHVRFTDQVPQLYKGAMLCIPTEETAYYLRVLESKQEGNEAMIHFVVPSIGEVIFNTHIIIDDDASEAARSAKSRQGKRNIHVSKSKSVDIHSGKLSYTMASTLTFGIDKFDVNGTLSMELDVDAPSISWDGISMGRVNRFSAGIKGKAVAEASVDLHPRLGVNVSKDYKWGPKKPDIPVTFAIGPLPVTMLISPALKTSGSASLKQGSLTVHQPFKMEGSVDFGVDYTPLTGAKPHGHVSWDFDRQEPLIDHSNEVEFGADFAPIYPEVSISFAALPILKATIDLKYAFKYNARSIIMGGQEVFQHKLGTEATVGAGVSVDLIKDLVSAGMGGDLFSLNVGNWDIFTEPKTVENMDSTRNVYLQHKSKAKHHAKMKAEKVDHVQTGQPKPTTQSVPLSNDVKAEIHTKAAIVNPKEDEGLLIMGGANPDSEKVDGEGLYEWANEYQVVEPELSTFNPIIEGYVPAGIEQKQLLRIVDPETQEVIDSTEIVPITSIKDYDLRLIVFEKADGRETTWTSDITVRDFGEDVVETGDYKSVFSCGNCGQKHVDTGTYQSSYKDKQSNMSIVLHEWGINDKGNCVIFTNSGAQESLLWAEFYARCHPSPAAPFVPRNLKDPKPYQYASLAETLDQTRWSIDMLDMHDDASADFRDVSYRGVDCAEVYRKDEEDIIDYWHNIVLHSHSFDGRTSIDVDHLTLLTDTIPGQPHGDPVTLIAAGGQSTNFGDGNLPENRVTAADKPNLPANFTPEEAGGIGVVDNSLGNAEWTDKWEPGIYEIGMDDERIMIAISTDKWTYYIPNVADHDGDNLEEFDDVDYDYSDYTFKMPCGFKWCDRGSTTYYYVENPATGNGEVKDFKFKDRAAMCNLMANHGFGDVKYILTLLKPEYLKRVADAGTHDDTYKTILKRYTK